MIGIPMRYNPDIAFPCAFGRLPIIQQLADDKGTFTITIVMYTIDLSDSTALAIITIMTCCQSTIDVEYTKARIAVAWRWRWTTGSRRWTIAPACQVVIFIWTLAPMALFARRRAIWISGTRIATTSSLRWRWIAAATIWATATLIYHIGMAVAVFMLTLVFLTPFHACRAL